MNENIENATPFIDIKGLSFSYADQDNKPYPVLHGINLRINAGEYIVILGKNGSGKSTLSKLINLVIDDLTYCSGQIIVDGTDILKDDFSEDDLIRLRKKVGMVFQNPDNQIVATIVEEDVAFGPENLGIPQQEIRERVDAALSFVGMTEYARHEPHRLSGGQKQRVAIAGIIAMRPACMIFDESTAMLDPAGRKEVLSTIEKLNREENITVISITHYMDEAARANRVIVLDEGRIILDGSPEYVFSQGDKLRQAGLELPQATAVSYYLKNRGISLKGPLNTPVECAQSIADAYRALQK